MSFELTPWMLAGREALDAFLAPRYRDAWPPAFDEAMRYPVFGGGKRVRPMLTYAAWRAIQGKDAPLDAAHHAAASIELVHTYSLVHDDLPAMDDDNERRGRPTVHIAYDEPTAILVGDGLLTDAFRILVEAPHPPAAQVSMVELVADAAGHKGMIGGQVADIRWAASPGDLAALEALHRGKTGALIHAATLLGGICAGATESQMAALATYGAATGLAFQLADDVLDADEDAGDDGPPNFTKLLGIQGTKDRAAALADQAVAAVAELPCADALVALARFTVERSI